MRTQKSWGLSFALWLSLLLSACGGGGNAGFVGDDGGGPGTPTPTPTQTPAFLFLNSSSGQLSSDADQGPEGVTLTAIVTDASGNVIPNVPVAFSIAPGSGALVAAGATTDVTGSLAAILTTGGNAALRTITVTATVEGLAARTLAVQVVNVGTPPPTAIPANLQVVASTTRLPSTADTADEGAVLTAFVTTAQGTLVPGVSVQFGVLSGPGFRSGALQITRGTTDDSGSATAILTTGGNPAAGTIRVEVRVVTASGTFIQAIDVQVAVAAGSVELFSSSNQLLSSASSVGSGVTVTAVVRDAQGLPVGGTNVQFAASSGQLSAGLVLTDSQGRAVTTLTTGGNATPRTIVLSASSAGSVSSPLSIQVVNAVSSIELLAARNQLASTADTPSEGVGLTAIVRDAQGNLLPGITVSFAGGSGGISPTRLVTDASGTATATLTTGGSSALRTITVIASSAGVTSNSVDVSVVADVPAPSRTITQIRLLGDRTQLFSEQSAVADGIQLTAIPTNSAGQTVPQVPVTFALASPNNSGALTTLQGITDANGLARAVLTTGGDSTTRTISVVASVDTGAGVVSQTFNVAVVSRVTSLVLIVSSPQLPSGADDPATEGIRVTAIARDVNNALVEGQAVAFSVDSGAIQVVAGITDPSGRATANLTTGGDPRNRRVTVTAATGTTSQSIGIDVSGSRLSLQGSPIIGNGTSSIYTASLTSSDTPGPIRDVPITLVSAVGNTVTPVTAITGADGTAQFEVMGNVSGADTLTATGLGLTSNSISIVVSQFRLDLVAPAAGTSPDIRFNTPTLIRASLLQNGASAGAGQPLTFSASRGIVEAVVDGGPCAAPTASANSVVVNTTTAGTASVCFTPDAASGPGPVTITIDGPELVQAVLNLNSVAINPTNIEVQVSPSTIAPRQTASVRAVVTDAVGNLVQNQLVSFQLDDATGGSLSSASGFTNAQGLVEVVYQATDASSSFEGVRITGRINGIPATPGSNPDLAVLTVAEPAVFVTLGTDENIVDNDAASTYDKQFIAVFTDAAGNPAPAGTTYRVSVTPLAYQKGFYTFDPIAGFWVINYNAASPPTPSGLYFDATIPPPPGSVPNVAPDFNGVFEGCVNEDVDRDGLRDPGEDYNNNGVLDPGGVLTVPRQTAIDASGIAAFSLRYPQNYGGWTAVLLRVTATVSGSESTASRLVVLPVAASDLTDQGVAPPGATSPFGLDSDCRNNF